MRIRTIDIIKCCLLCGLMTGGLALAQVYQSPESPGAAGHLENAISVAGKYQNYIYGVVNKVGKDELILDRTRFGDGQVFKLDHKTKYMDNGKRSTLADLKTGDMVWVDAKIRKKTNEKIAKKVIKGVGPKAVSR